MLLLLNYIKYRSNKSDTPITKCNKSDTLITIY